MIGDPSQISYYDLHKVLEKDETFAREALPILERDYDRPKSTYSAATSAVALLDKWIQRRELLCHDERGEVVTDFNPVLSRGDDDYATAEASVESGWLIDRASFVQLVDRYGMSIPATVGFKPGPDKTLLPNEFGYTVDGAAHALFEQFGADETKWRARILAAVRIGELRVRDPYDGVYCNSERICSWIERIAIADLNAWLKKSGATFQISLLSNAAKSAPSVTKSWMHLVQMEASRRWIGLRKGHANPTKYSLVDELANWCRENGIKTKTGISPDREYIYRHALRRWTPPDD